MREDLESQLPYKLLLSESYGPVYESIISNIPLTERTSLRVIDRTIGDLVTRKYEFILHCIRKYEDYIENHEVEDLWDSFARKAYYTEKFEIQLPSDNELRLQLIEPHFSWLVFLYCLNNMNPGEEQLEELISVFLQDDFIKIRVKARSRYSIEDIVGHMSESWGNPQDNPPKTLITRISQPATLYQGHSQKYLVLTIIIRTNINNLDNIDEYLFDILVRDLTVYELETLARFIISRRYDDSNPNVEDNSYVFQYLKSVLNLPPASRRRYLKYGSLNFHDPDLSLDVPSILEVEHGVEHSLDRGSLDHILVRVYEIWMGNI